MIFDQILLIDQRPKDGCGLGPDIFSSDALALERSLCVSLCLSLPSPT